MSEWLDNIKNQLGQADKFLNENGNQAVEVTVSVMNKLIQQAERAEELKNRCTEIAAESAAREEKLLKENRRHKQALEFYADKKNFTQSESEYFEGYPPEVMNDRGYKARQALEEES